MLILIYQSLELELWRFMKNSSSSIEFQLVLDPIFVVQCKFIDSATTFLRLACFGGWTRGAFKYPADSSLRELIHTMVTDNDDASTFWAGNPSDSSTFFVSLSVSSSLQPRFFRFSLFFSRPSVVGAPSFFISFPTSLCAASSLSTSSSTKIALFQRVPPLWGLAAVFESPIIRGRPSIPIESRHTVREQLRTKKSSVSRLLLLCLASRWIIDMHCSNVWPQNCFNRRQAAVQKWYGVVKSDNGKIWLRVIFWIFNITFFFIEHPYNILTSLIVLDLSFDIIYNSLKLNLKLIIYWKTTLQNYYPRN